MGNTENLIGPDRGADVAGVIAPVAEHPDDVVLGQIGGSKVEVLECRAGGGAPVRGIDRDLRRGNVFKQLDEFRDGEGIVGRALGADETIAVLRGRSIEAVADD